MKRKLSLIAQGIVLTGLMLLPFSAVLAAPFDDAQKNMATVAATAEIGGTTELPVMIGNIINIVLGFLGILLLFYFIYAGFLWMTDAGGEKNKEKATKMMSSAVIGLVIIVAAYAISNFVITQISEKVLNAG
jgi:hypothetical protein